MDTPVPPPVFERERVTSSPGFPRRHKIIFGVIVIVGIILYAGFNLWVYQNSISGKNPFRTALWHAITSSNSGFGGTSTPSVVPRPSSVIPANAWIQSKIIVTPTSPPTPTPLQGPGTYACDPLGICNLYDNPTGKGCPKTFADSRCLGQCGDKSNWCPK